MPTVSADFSFQFHGSICLLEPLTSGAFAWVRDHLPTGVPTWDGAIVIEPRYIARILEGIHADALTVQDDQGGRE